MDYSFLEGYCDPDARDCATAERAFVRFLDGGCSSPVAAYGEIREGELYLRGLYYNEKTGTYVTGTLSGAREDGEELGCTLARTLREKGERDE